jgi:hypothetical protein
MSEKKLILTALDVGHGFDVALEENAEPTLLFEVTSHTDEADPLCNLRSIQPDGTILEEEHVLVQGSTPNLDTVSHHERIQRIEPGVIEAGKLIVMKSMGSDRSGVAFSAAPVKQVQIKNKHNHKSLAS